MGERAPPRSSTSALESRDPADALLSRIEGLLLRRQSAEALSAARAFEQAHPLRAEGLVLAGRALQQLGDLEAALRAAERARERLPGHPAARMLWIELVLALGDLPGGLAELRVLAVQTTTTGSLRQDVGRLFTQLNLHEDAERCFAAGAAELPETPEHLYNWATALTAVGRLTEAETVLDRVIALAPDDGDAYYNRSTLRRQMPASNHVAEIDARLRRSPPDPAVSVALEYALAKELEDLGEYQRSFAALARGARLRRSRLSYRVADDVDAMAAIARSFDAAYLARAGAGHPDRRPVFIVGLPRSGTTLVDRILSSHSAVASRGEASDFAAAIMRRAAPARSKLDLIERAARIDSAVLAADYRARLPLTAADRVIDKTPLNFLYVGLIRAALPGAAIIHVRRRPLDVCYAIYKTLFRMAYPFSYALDDLGHYYLAYRRLMAHWREAMPGAMLEVDYEDLVDHQEDVSRRLIAHCGLEWEAQCLSFERNSSPSLTASAAQVRQPIYRSSVGLSGRYRQELEPLATILRAAGVDPEDGACPAA